MAAPNLPSLTRHRSNVVSIPAATDVLVLTQLEILVNASPYWIVESSDLVGSPPYVEIRPRLEGDSPAAPSAPPLPDQRIIFAGQGLSAGSMGPYGTSPSNRIGAPGANDIAVLFAPEGGSGSKKVGFPDEQFPYESGGDLFSFEGWWGLSGDMNGAQSWDLFIISSNEEVAVWLRNTSLSGTSASLNGGLIGANASPPTDDANDADTGDRLFTLALISSYINVSFWTSNASLFNWPNNDANFAKQRFLMRDPASGNTVGCNAFKFDQAPTAQNLVSGSGAFVGLDVPFFMQYGIGWTLPNIKFGGFLRQIRPFHDMTGQSDIEDGASVVQGYSVGATRTSATDSVFEDAS